MRPERRCKSGMDGGLRAAVRISPPLHLRTDEILSNRWGPPQNPSILHFRVSGERQSTAGQLRKLLQAADMSALAKTVSLKADQAEMAKLRSLGYLGARPSTQPPPRADPKSKIAV